MRPSIVLVLVLLPSPCIAQSAIPAPLPDVWHVSAATREGRRDPIIAVPMVEQIRTDGSRARLRGVLIAKEVASNVTIGLGLLDMKPRKSALSPNPGLDGSSRGSRKAAVRLSVNF